jgi:hypothetical protein
MMVRLPVPGQDQGHWGKILNTFLAVGHRSDGTLKGVQSGWNVRDYGAVGDGKTDDSQAFAQALAQIPATGGLLFIPAGIYQVTEIVLQERSDVFILGSGTASVIAPTSGKTGITYRSCRRCHLGNLRIDGGLNGGKTGLDIAGNFDAKLFNLHINDMSGDGIVINGDDPTGCEIELYDVTCRDNGGYGYHYLRTNAVDTGGVYLTTFRSLYNTRGAGGIKIESSHSSTSPVFHMLNNVVADNYPTTAIVVHNVAHCRFSGVWAGGKTDQSIIMIDGEGHMIEIDGAYIVNDNPKGYNISINGTANGLFLDKLDFDGSPVAHIHVGSQGANFFLGQYQSFGTSPLTDTPRALYRRSSFTMQHGPVLFQTDSSGSTSTSVGFDDIQEPGKQKWIRNDRGTLQILNTAFTTGLLELQDNGQLRWNNGAWITRHLSNTAAWEPGTIAPGAYVSTTVAVPQAAVGDTVSAGFTIALPAGVLISGAVTAPGTVTVTLYNAAQNAQQLGMGMLRADIWQH